MIILTYVEDTDRWVRSSSTNYGTALNGANLQVNEDDIGVYGQTYARSDNTRYIRQYFVEFDYTLPSGQQPVSGFWSIRNNVTHGTDVYRRMEILGYDWGGTVTTGNWRTPAQLQSMEVEGNLLQVNNLANNRWSYTGIRRMLGSMFDSGMKRYVIVTNRNRVQTSPSTVEYNSVYSSRAADSDYRPHLVVGTTTLNAMSGTLAAQIQLSTGNWIVIERTNMTREFQIRIIHRTLSSDSLIWESPVSTGLVNNDNILGSHSYSLCRDNQDNFFVVSAGWERTDGFEIVPFRKGSGDTWTRISPTFAKRPDADGNTNIQATACTWHNVSTGRLMVMGAADWGEVGGTPGPWALIDAGAALSGASNPVLNSGTLGDAGIIAEPSRAGQQSAVNSTGTLFDAQADPVDPYSGYLVTAERNSILGDTNSLSIGHYRIYGGGASLSPYTKSRMDDSGGYAVIDPDSKARLLCVGNGDVVKITADNRADWGITLDRWRFQTNSSGVTKISSIPLDQESVPNLPDGGSVGATPLWDAVHFPPDNNVWIYYFDSTDDRRLLRTSVSMSDDLAAQNSVEVNAAVGASGDDIHAIRVQRNALVTDEVLITISRETSGGVHEYEYIIDRINLAPTQPQLHASDNFDSTVDHEFSWTFRDPNLSDSQTAFQLQVLRVSDSGVEFDTGKVASSNEFVSVSGGSITNNDDYLWRVRTWDVDDAVSPWSTQRSFSTSNTGVIDITDPAADNQDGIFVKDYLVKWSLTGATQDDYRLRLIRVSDSSVHTDTGWVTSSTQQHLVTEILSDVEYRIEVTTRSSMVESNTATRLITTDYDTSELPLVSLEVVADREYVNVIVENPEARGDRPNPTINQIYRRPLDSSERFLMVGTCPPNSTFRDYTVASGMRYEYKARAGVEE